ncbi:MAG: hypothetical protein ACYCZR_07300 [Burkholderiales bacterium]
MQFELTIRKECTGLRFYVLKHASISSPLSMRQIEQTGQFKHFVKTG